MDRNEQRQKHQLDEGRGCNVPYRRDAMGHVLVEDGLARMLPQEPSFVLLFDEQLEFDEEFLFAILGFLKDTALYFLCSFTNTYKLLHSVVS
jgi:hypothetical protein